MPSALLVDTVATNVSPLYSSSTGSNPAVSPNAPTKVCACAGAEINASHSTPTAIAPARATDRALNMTIKSTQPSHSVIANDDLWETLFPTGRRINPAVALRHRQPRPLGNTIPPGDSGQA